MWRIRAIWRIVVWLARGGKGWPGWTRRKVAKFVWEMSRILG